MATCIPSHSTPRPADHMLVQALDLPEIRTLVAQYLGLAQLASAARVCRGWNASFSPHLYAEVFCWRDASRIDAIERNAHHVRYLDIVEDPEEFSLEWFSHLSELYFRTYYMEESLQERFLSLIRRNVSLHEVTLRIYNNNALLFNCLVALSSSCPDLKRLVLVMPDGYDHQTTQLLMQICVHLEQFCIYTGDAPPLQDSDAPAEFPAMRILRFGFDCSGSPHAYLGWIRRCPQLASLYWNFGGLDIFPTASFCEILSTSCPHVERLDFGKRVLEDDDLAQVLASCAKITDFATCGSLFGPLAFESLIRHFPHLTLLDLTRCNGVTSSMSLKVLTSCPLLTEFCAGGSLAAQDVVGVGAQDDEGQEKLEPQDWVCVSLKRLSISISGLRNRPPEWQGLILGQIARLHNLRELNIGPKSGELHEDAHIAAMELDEDDGIQLKLDAGLAILSGLKRLEVIGFLGLRLNMDEEDVRWMLDAWPNLVGIVGKVHCKNHEELEAFLEDRDNLCTIFSII